MADFLEGKGRKNFKNQQNELRYEDENDVDFSGGFESMLFGQAKAGPPYTNEFIAEAAAECEGRIPRLTKEWMQNRIRWNNEPFDQDDRFLEGEANAKAAEINLQAIYNAEISSLSAFIPSAEPPLPHSAYNAHGAIERLAKRFTETSKWLGRMSRNVDKKLKIVEASGCGFKDQVVPPGHLKDINNPRWLGIKKYSEARRAMLERLDEFDQSLDSETESQQAQWLGRRAWAWWQRMGSIRDPRLILWEAQARCTEIMFANIAPEIAEMINPVSAPAGSVSNIVGLCATLTVLEADLQRKNRIGSCFTPPGEVSLMRQISNFATGLARESIKAGKADARTLLTGCGHEVASEFAATIKTNRVDEVFSDTAIEMDIINMTTNDLCSYQKQEVETKTKRLQQTIDTIQPLNVDLAEKMEQIAELEKQVKNLQELNKLAAKELII